MVKIKTSKENIYRIRLEIVNHPIHGIEYPEEQTNIDNRVIYVPDVEVSKSFIEEQLLSQVAGTNIVPILFNTHILKNSQYEIDESSVIDVSRVLSFIISSYHEFEYKEYTIKALNQRDIYMFTMTGDSGFKLLDREIVTLDEALDTVTYDLSRHDYDISSINIDELIDKTSNGNINPESILDSVEWSLLHDYLVEERSNLTLNPIESKYII